MRETQAIDCLGGLRETLVQDLRRQGIRGAAYAGPWMFQVVQDGTIITESAKHIPTVVDIICLHGDPPPEATVLAQLVRSSRAINREADPTASCPPSLKRTCFCARPGVGRLPHAFISGIDGLAVRLRKIRDSRASRIRRVPCVS